MSHEAETTVSVLFKSIKLRLIVMSSIWNTEKQNDREKEKVHAGDRPAKLDERKSERELEREMKNKGDILCWKDNMKNLKRC